MYRCCNSKFYLIYYKEEMLEEGEDMKIGASSSCFYPLETEKAFLRIAEAGIRTAEIFLNSPSELNKAFISELKVIKDAYGVDVRSLHPYRSFSEGYDIFSKYERRFEDVKDVFKRYFDAAGELGAEFIILHGARGKAEISIERYAERYFELYRIAESMGCTLAHENVVGYVGSQPEFMSFMKNALGDSFKMVLDIKQARRAGADFRKFIDVMGENIVHVHLSDCDKERDCIPPSEKGLFDFSELFTLLQNVRYKGKYIVELYSDSFSNDSEIVSSTMYLQRILNGIEEGSKEK